MLTTGIGAGMINHTCRNGQELPREFLHFRSENGSSKRDTCIPRDDGPRPNQDKQVPKDKPKADFKINRQAWIKNTVSLSHAIFSCSYPKKMESVYFSFP